MPALLLLDRWLSTAVENPADFTSNLANAGTLASSFRRWISDPENRIRSRRPRKPVTPRMVNNGLGAVVELLAYVADNRDECHRVIGPSPWDDLSDAHASIWRKHTIRHTRKKDGLHAEHYVDDHALAQITASLPISAANRNDTVIVTVNGIERRIRGLGDPEVMRMLLLQMLTGRRINEICMCDFNCLSPATGQVANTAADEPAAVFRYAQSKIDQAPDTILVDAEVAAVIAEQQQWVRAHYPGTHSPRYLFPQRLANANGSKHVSASSYWRALRQFSARVGITDSNGKPVLLSRTHRFRHTRLTRLAELGLPIHVLQRYAGHATPTMDVLRRPA